MTKPKTAPRLAPKSVRAKEATRERVVAMMAIMWEHGPLFPGEIAQIALADGIEPLASWLRDAARPDISVGCSLARHTDLVSPVYHKSDNRRWCVRGDPIGDDHVHQGPVLSGDPI